MRIPPRKAPLNYDYPTTSSGRIKLTFEIITSQRFQERALAGEFSKPGTASNKLPSGRLLREAMKSPGNLPERRIAIAEAVLKSDLFFPQGRAAYPEAFTLSTIIRVFNAYLIELNCLPMLPTANKYTPEQLQTHFNELRQAKITDENAQNAALEGKLTSPDNEQDTLPSVRLIKAALDSREVSITRKVEIAIAVTSSEAFVADNRFIRPDLVGKLTIIEILNQELRNREKITIRLEADRTSTTPQAIREEYNRIIADPTAVPKASPPNVPQPKAYDEGDQNRALAGDFTLPDQPDDKAPSIRLIREALDSSVVPFARKVELALAATASPCFVADNRFISPRLIGKKLIIDIFNRDLRTKGKIKILLDPDRADTNPETIRAEYSRILADPEAKAKTPTVETAAAGYGLQVERITPPLRVKPVPTPIQEAAIETAFKALANLPIGPEYAAQVQIIIDNKCQLSPSKESRVNVRLKNKLKDDIELEIKPSANDADMPDEKFDQKFGPLEKILLEHRELTLVGIVKSIRQARTRKLPDVDEELLAQQLLDE
ncbi:MAG: hypothetical protein ABIE84_02200 [bacterium]